MGSMDLRSTSPIGIDIGTLESEQDVLTALAQLSAVKGALEAADRFREESVKFAKYEAYALVRAVEISGDASLVKGKWRKMAAEWLHGLSDDERDSYIAMCENGKTIDNVYRDKVFKPEQRSALGAAVEECKQAARTKLYKDGMVVVPDVVCKYSTQFPRAMVKEITDGVRDAVRRAGGVGIGDQIGTYINPDKKSQYIADAIETRVEAVARDVESIADLASRCESKPTFHVKGDGQSLSFVDVTYLILAGVGCAYVKFDSLVAKKNSVSVLRQIAGDLRE